MYYLVKCPDCGQVAHYRVSDSGKFKRLTSECKHLTQARALRLIQEKKHGANPQGHAPSPRNPTVEDLRGIPTGRVLTEEKEGV